MFCEHSRLYLHERECGVNCLACTLLCSVILLQNQVGAHKFRFLEHLPDGFKFSLAYDLPGRVIQQHELFVSSVIRTYL